MDKDIVKVNIEGLELEIDKAVIDNMELVDALAEMKDDDDVMSISRVSKMIFGTHRKKLYDHLRTEKGTVPVEKVSDAIQTTFRALGDSGKNS